MHVARAASIAYAAYTQEMNEMNEMKEMNISMSASAWWTVLMTRGAVPQEAMPQEAMPQGATIVQVQPKLQAEPICA